MGAQPPLAPTSGAFPRPLPSTSNAHGAANKPVTTVFKLKLAPGGRR